MTELLKGRTLREEMSPAVGRDLQVRHEAGRKPAPYIRLDKALDYAAQIADGLAAVHVGGIVHRDPKFGPPSRFHVRQFRRRWRKAVTEHPDGRILRLSHLGVPAWRTGDVVGRVGSELAVCFKVGRTKLGPVRVEQRRRLRQYNAEVAPEPDWALEAWTPLGFQVQVTRDRWRLITTAKHPVMVGREDAVRVALEQPEQVRESRSDPNVLLFYRLERPGRWTCVVARRVAPPGFLITAYPTDAIKEGTQIWPK